MAYHFMKEYKITINGEKEVIEQIKNVLFLSTMLEYEVNENKSYDWLNEPLYVTYEFCKNGEWKFTLDMQIKQTKQQKRALVKKKLTLRQTFNTISKIELLWPEYDPNGFEFIERKIVSTSGKTKVLDHLLKSL